VILNLLALSALLGGGGVTAWTLTQKDHAILRRFGPLGFVRYGMEWWRPKNHQYQEGPGDGRPFSLIRREQVYRASKGVDDTVGFGTTKDLHVPGTHTIAPADFGLNASEVPDDSFTVGVGRLRNAPYDKYPVPVPAFTVKYPLMRSAMSFGALSGVATRAFSDGAALLGDGFLDNTGEGGMAPHHCPVTLEGQAYLDKLTARAKALGHKWVFRFDKTATTEGGMADVELDLHTSAVDARGRVTEGTSVKGDLGASEKPRNLIVQLGPSLSGFRLNGTDNIDWEFLDYVCGLSWVRGIEFKLHQGAKPNSGGVVKQAKMTDELKALRCFPAEGDYVSPERHPFIPTGNVEEQIEALMHYMGETRDLPNFKKRGLLLGIKTVYTSDVRMSLLAKRIRQGHPGAPDYIVIDGAEGGTGGASPILTDHVGLHLYQSVWRTHNILNLEGVRDRVKLVASGRIVNAADVAFLMALGADYCNAGRAYLMSMGCIQSQQCHNNTCPTGITTQSGWGQRALVSTVKSHRVYNYGKWIQKTFVKLARVAGVNLTEGERFELTDIHVVTGVGQVTRGDKVYLSS
jgi:glutamate synthase domain-containing protein 2